MTVRLRIYETIAVPSLWRPDGEMIAKKTTTVGKGGESRRKPATFRPLPSKAWLKGGVGILKGLSFPEWMILIGRIFLPVLDKISKIVSVGVAIKIVVYGVKTTPDDQTRLLLGGAIFMAFGIAGMIQVAAESVRERMETLIGSLVQKILDDSDSGVESPDGKSERESRQIRKKVGKGLSAAVGFSSSLALIVILTVMVGWFDPRIGIAVLFLGLLLVNGLRLRRQKKPKSSRQSGTVAKSRRNPVEGEVAAIGENAFEVENETPPLSKGERRRSGKRIRKIRVGMISNFSAALVMAASFLLLSRAHALDEGKIHWIIIFCLGMRLLMAEGAVAIKWWLEMLDQKNTLMDVMVRAARKHA